MNFPATKELSAFQKIWFVMVALTVLIKRMRQIAQQVSLLLLLFQLLQINITCTCKKTKTLFKIMQN